ncbi:MAG: RoPhREQ2 gp58 [Sphingomonadales bacterium]|nr:RoPhREQ2 gp58 [Sphingomonadales bacterium]
MDLTRSIVAKSDQLNADDLMGGPRTFTVAEVREGNDEQPVSIVLAEWPGNRPFKPSKTVTRLLVAAWGPESDNWPTGARMTLFRDASVKWAGQAIGGIRVSHLSHIDKQMKVALQETKGKKVLHTINVLAETAPTSPPVSEQDVRVAALRNEWKTADADRKAAIEAEVNSLTSTDATAGTGGGGE